MTSIPSSHVCACASVVIRRRSSLPARALHPPRRALNHCHKQTMTHRLTHPYTLHSAVIQSEIKNRTTSYVSPAMRAQAETLGLSAGFGPSHFVKKIGEVHTKTGMKVRNMHVLGLCAIDAASDYRLPTSAHFLHPKHPNILQLQVVPIRAGHVRSSNVINVARIDPRTPSRLPSRLSSTCTASVPFRTVYSLPNQPCSGRCSTRLSCISWTQGYLRSLKSESNNGI